MAKRKENTLGSRLRELLKDFEGLFAPQQPKRALVPIPVRVPRPNTRRNRY